VKTSKRRSNSPQRFVVTKDGEVWGAFNPFVFSGPDLATD